MLVGSDLATLIQTALGGSSVPITFQISGLANAIVAHEQSAVVNFIPGSIIGNSPPAPGPIIAGTGIDGLTVLDPSALQAALLSVFGSTTSQIMGLATSISTTLSNGKVQFAPGLITGASTAIGPPTPTPGVFIGAGTGGLVTGLDGSALDSLLVGVLGGSSSEIHGLSTTITDYVTTNALSTLTIASGTVPVAGGPIVAGTGTGIIS